MAEETRIDPLPADRMVLASAPAEDAKEVFLESGGQKWAVAWHPPGAVPPGQPHGCNALCVSGPDVVLISPDGQRWGWPGGHPLDGESWEDTLRREVLEETCATVVEARLLGFTRSVCLEGHQQGLVLVRCIWRADVHVLPWNPQFEIKWRTVMPAADVGRYFWMDKGSEPIAHRALIEAGLV
jgi:NUDIX domain